ncbi:MAG: 3-phosphoglycerate dehydrogenase [Planctomycetota bacterium]|nr:MAG: 3-phosphoglycerate dehydrogenase [Planctomycetota bacterium]
MSKTRILITTTSFQDTPGRHHDLLPADQFEIERARGPLPEAEILKLVGTHDAIICGDDAFTKPVLEKCLPRLRVLSKYGIGVDKIDIPAATSLKIPVTFCPGVNHVTVAEHTFGLLLSLTRLIPPQDALIKKGEWKRSTGRELAGKTMGILGLGRIGKEVAKRAKAFDMNVVAFDVYWDEAFAKQYGVERKPTGEDVLKASEVVSLHMNLTDENKDWLNAARLSIMKRGAYLINCARGGLVHQGDIAAALKSGQLGGYGCDVVEPEPIEKSNPLLAAPNVVFTPHTGSRTYESVERQALMAAENMIRVLGGQAPHAQANKL